MRQFIENIVDILAAIFVVGFGYFVVLAVVFWLDQAGWDRQKRDEKKNRAMREQKDREIARLKDQIRNAPDGDAVVTTITDTLVRLGLKDADLFTFSGWVAYNGRRRSAKIVSDRAAEMVRLEHGDHKH